MKVLIMTDENGGGLIYHKLSSNCIRGVDEIFIAENFAEVKLILEKECINTIFLDYVLNEASVFKFLNLIDFNSYSIVFVSNQKELSVKALRYGIVDCVLKTIDGPQLQQLIDRIGFRFLKEQSLETKLPSNGLRKIVISKNNKYRFYEIEDVAYFEANGSYTKIYFEDSKSQISTRSLGYYESALKVSSFYRVHHSFLVNINRIKQFDSGICELELQGGFFLPLSKRKKTDFFKVLEKTVLR